MKQILVSETKYHRLTLFFAGWGMDETPFKDYKTWRSDLMICYDYRDLYFDKSLLEGYDYIRVIGWSMGVWVASMTTQLYDLNFDESLAINGTIYPIDDEKGIPTDIFEGTLKGLNNATLQKFYRRMCGSDEAYREFQKVTPKRSVEELREELAFIGFMCRNLPTPEHPYWEKIVIGNQDRIFPPVNQILGKGHSFTEIETVDAAHYAPELFRRLFKTHG